MIAMIAGEVVELSAPTACILTASGVGYEVELPLPAFCDLTVGEQAKIWTHLVVREDAQILCGFGSLADKYAFKKLIKISGVGVRMALAMLSTMNAGELALCIAQGDEARLTRVAGVGKKTAQRLLIELKGKLDDLATGEPASHAELLPSATNEMAVLAEVEGALISLGYKEKEAQQAIAQARQGMDVLDTQSLLKLTLQQLAKF